MEEMPPSLKEEFDSENEEKYNATQYQNLDAADNVINQTIDDGIQASSSMEWVSASLPLHFTSSTLKMEQSKPCGVSCDNQSLLQQLFAVPASGTEQEFSDKSSSCVKLAVSATAVSSHGDLSNRHKCTLCGKDFMSKTTLNNHFKTHSKERPHVCKECNRAFKQMSNLIQHRRVHTGERPYACTFCDKSFKQKSQVMQHERLHTGEKPYTCSRCQRAFVQLSQLNYHEKSHKGKDLSASPTTAVGENGEKHTKVKRSRKRKIQENKSAVKPSCKEISPVYILNEDVSTCEGGSDGAQA
eukprot:gene14207-15689_t